MSLYYIYTTTRLVTEVIDKFMRYCNNDNCIKEREAFTTIIRKIFEKERKSSCFNLSRDAETSEKKKEGSRYEISFWLIVTRFLFANL